MKKGGGRRKCSRRVVRTARLAPTSGVDRVIWESATENRLARNEKQRVQIHEKKSLKWGVGCGGFRVECTKQNRARKGGREGEEPQARSLSTTKPHGARKSYGYVVFGVGEEKEEGNSVFDD